MIHLKNLQLKTGLFFICREHLIEKCLWRRWAFAIVLLFNELKIRRYRSSGVKKFRLEVDLRNQSYGIYNNAGKRFLKNKFQNEEFKSRCIERSKEIEDFLKSTTPGNDELTINAMEMPLRWASGGMLPIAQWKDKYWYVLNFRDIEPVGWNVANGASETKEEYKNLYSLIYREFSEELVLLNREPYIGDTLHVTQKMFQFPHPLPEEISRKIINKEFAQKHKQLRKDHDGLIVQFEDGPEIKPISTPFEVQVTCHDENLRDTVAHSIPNVIFTVNPTEFGIEVLLVSCFEMNDNDYLIDGEMWGKGKVLVRRPVMLLSCDYVQEIYNKNKTLGTYVETPPSLDCKCLEKIPAGEYRVFDKDIEFRKRRLEILRKDNKTKEAPEAEYYRKWLENYELLFKKIKDSENGINRNEHSALTMLCPVTWKTLETICYYKLLQNKA